VPARLLLTLLWLHGAEESGSSVCRNMGLGKEGNRHLRKAVYMPALVAIKYNAPVRHFACWLRAAGKPKMSIVCAAMRKLIHIASAYSNINSLSIPPSHDYTTALHFRIVSTTRMTPGA
jgi:Transposase IS116/IS110/IS902 family